MKLQHLNLQKVNESNEQNSSVMKNLDEIKFPETKRQQAGMSVPDGFFEQFQQQLEAKIDTLEAVRQAPVVEMPARSRWLKGWAIAACAMLIVGIGIGIGLMTGDEPSATTTEQQMAQGENSDEENEMEDMMLRSVNDFELYEYYCEL